MSRLGIAVISGIGLLLAGCATSQEPSAGGASGGTSDAVANLTDASGGAKGRATVAASGGGVRVVVEAVGLTPGAHGLHLHTVGRCDAPDFTSAGPHWNPTGKMHGRDNPAGLHWGDLPNLIVGTDGTGRLEATIAEARLTGGSMPLLDADGAAIVIHATADDYKTDPSGNSGGRVACGVFAG